VYRNASAVDRPKPVAIPTARDPPDDLADEPAEGGPVIADFGHGLARVIVLSVRMCFRALLAAPFLDEPGADLRLGHLGELFGECVERPQCFVPRQAAGERFSEVILT
jgi:hypothetical protein